MVNGHKYLFAYKIKFEDFFTKVALEGWRELKALVGQNCNEGHRDEGCVVSSGPIALFRVTKAELIVVLTTILTNKINVHISQKYPLIGTVGSV